MDPEPQPAFPPCRPPPLPILYQNPTATTILLDIPASIQAAQGTPDRPCRDTLLSSPAPQEPYIVHNEPKSVAARAKIENNIVDARLHAEYRDLILAALEEIRRHHHGPWCLPRTPAPDALQRDRRGDHGGQKENISRKRKRLNEGLEGGAKEDRVEDDVEETTTAAPPITSLLQGIQSLTLQSLWHTQWPAALEHLIPDSLSESPYTPYSSIHNSASHAVTLPISAAELPTPVPCPSSKTHNFTVPPGATFLLSSHHRFKKTLPTSLALLHHQHQFDLLLLDPPYPNASARRRATYSTHPRSTPDLRSILAGLDLGPLLAPAGHVAIWTTNSAAARALILGPEGVFDGLGATLVEEWVWAKVTAGGAPITDLDGLWRKPYEVLLIGRRVKAVVAGGEDDDDDEDEEEDEDHDERDTKTPKQDAKVPVQVKRRILVAVPDFHSRKPCLRG
ncbi:MAG: hypothetical protein M1819_001272 [Sarea resinae]|nr:MAG: hypothetical protein M1819_001272 [Sarea resinae]